MTGCRVSPEEREAIRVAAKQAGTVTVSAWMRDVLVRATRNKDLLRKMQATSVRDTNREQALIMEWLDLVARRIALIKKRRRGLS